MCPVCLSAPAAPNPSSNLRGAARLCATGNLLLPLPLAGLLVAFLAGRAVFWGDFLVICAAVPAEGAGGRPWPGLLLSRLKALIFARDEAVGLAGDGECFIVRPPPDALRRGVVSEDVCACACACACVCACTSVLGSPTPAEGAVPCTLPPAPTGPGPVVRVFLTTTRFAPLKSPECCRLCSEDNEESGRRDGVLRAEVAEGLLVGEPTWTAELPDSPPDELCIGAEGFETTALSLLSLLLFSLPPMNPVEPIPKEGFLLSKVALFCAKFLSIRSP